MKKIAVQLSKHKVPQRRTVGCIDVVSFLEMKVSPLVENVVAMLKSDVLATLWQRSDNVKRSEVYKVPYNVLYYFFLLHANILVFLENYIMGTRDN